MARRARSVGWAKARMRRAHQQVLNSGMVSTLRFAHPTTLLIQPHILEAQVVVLAVVMRPEPLDIGLPAIRRRLPDDAGTRGVLGEQTLDLPDDVPALLLVELA